MRDSSKKTLIFVSTPQMEGLIGERFGRLLVVSSAGKVCTPRGTSYYVNTQCDCGSLAVSRVADLKIGRCKSCGCLQRELSSKRSKKHGMAIHGKTRGKIYRASQGMLRRCDSKSGSNWEFYGKKGIKVCERWKGEDGFVNFLSDVGEPPTAKHTIDRYPNVSGNYEPSNVRWATVSDQNNNRSSTIFVDVDGVRMSLKQAANKCAANYSAVRYTMRSKKCTAMEALTACR